MGPLGGVVVHPLAVVLQVGQRLIDGGEFALSGRGASTMTQRLSDPLGSVLVRLECLDPIDAHDAGGSDVGTTDRCGRDLKVFGDVENVGEVDGPVANLGRKLVADVAQDVPLPLSPVARE